MALYPPIVASSMPAFNIADGKVRIYYSLSAYNSNKKDDISVVQVTVRRQSSNVNVLNSQTEIVEKSFGLQQTKDISNNRYYIEIENKDITQGFQEDVLYKVQLRFSTASNTNNTAQWYSDNIEKFSEWSTVCIIKPIVAPLFYIDDFHVEQDETEPIEQTNNTVFENTESSTTTGETTSDTNNSSSTETANENTDNNSSTETIEEDTNNFFSNLADFVGIYKRSYTDSSGTQKSSSQALRSWRLRLLGEGYNQNLNIEDYLLADSGWVLNSANNYYLDSDSVALECSLPYEFTQKKNYKLLFEIQTKNGYTDSHLYTFTYQQQIIDVLNGELHTYVNEEEGYIKLEYTSDQSDTTNIAIRRSDMTSNFKKWEDILNFEITDSKKINFTYYDFTAEAGMIYKYLVQKRDPRGRRGTPVYDQSGNSDSGNGILAEWNHAFLLESSGNGDSSKAKQLKLKYDFQISSLKTNIAESKTDTIGSKYPFIRRNGSMYYRSFPCTGTITGFMDDADLFTSKEKLLDNRVTEYDNYKGIIGDYTTQYDYTYERKFREAVQEFLYNTKPKLYKSTQEGNIFIKLMQVSLTPKNELGRLIYTFSATAYEIDEPTIANLNSYGIIDVGDYNPNIIEYQTRMTQLNNYSASGDPMGVPFKAGQDIIGTGQTPAANSIAKKLRYNQSFNDTILTDFSISWLRMTINSAPYLIRQRQEDNKFVPFDDYIDSEDTSQDKISEPINYPLYQIESTYNRQNIYLGWLFYLDDNHEKSIIVSLPNNVYELNEPGLILSKDDRIIPAKDTYMEVDFRAETITAQDLTKVPKNIRMKNVNGQFIGTFNEETELIARIKYKYKYTYEEGKDKIERTVNGVKNVSIDTQPGAIIMIRTDNEKPQRFVVNETGQLNFETKDFDLNITSLKIVGMNIDLRNVRERTGQYNNINQVQNPLNGDYCIIGDNKYYYYKNQWVTATTLNENEHFIDIKCSVDAIVNYFCSVRRDYY